MSIQLTVEGEKYILIRYREIVRGCQSIDRRKKEIHTYCMYQDEARCVQFVIFSDISLRPFFLAVP